MAFEATEGHDDDVVGKHDEQKEENGDHEEVLK